MKTKYKFFTTILTLVFLSTTLVLPQVEATSSPWAAGARTSLSSNVSEISGFVGVPHLPASNAQNGNTLLWTGGWSQSARYLNQPEIRAFSSGWTGVFEVFDASTGLDAENSVTSNVVMSTGDTARFDLYLSSNQSCQTVKDATTNAIATKCFSANNYGSTYTINWTELEAYSTTSSDFSAMDGTTSFTSVKQYVSGVGSSMTGSTYFSPSCVSASGGTGSLDITLTSC